MDQNIHKKFTERQNELRLYIIQFIVDHQRPYHLDQDMTKLKKDGMVIDEERNVNFIYPVSALQTSHHVTLQDGREFTAMCAIDAIGAAFTFHQDTEIHSACASCNEPVHIRIVDGKVAEYSPKNLHALTFPLGELSNWAGSC